MSFKLLMVIGFIMYETEYAPWQATRYVLRFDHFAVRLLLKNCGHNQFGWLPDFLVGVFEVFVLDRLVVEYLVVDCFFVMGFIFVAGFIPPSGFLRSSVPMFGLRPGIFS